MKIDHDALLAEIATRYYVRDQSQQEIADQLDLSRSNVSRLLKEAHTRHIVEISIRHPSGRLVHLEHALMNRFQLREAGVVPAIAEDAPGSNSHVTNLACEMLDSLLVNAKSLGISWGTTIHQIGLTFAPRQRHDVQVIQMMGGVGSSNPAIDGPAVAQSLAHALTGRYHYLHAPLIVDRPATARALLEQRTVAETLRLAAQVDVALVGIGAVDPTVSSLLHAGFLTDDEFQRIEADGVVGDICARHFDINGLPAAPELDQRLIAITLDQLAGIPVVMAVAYGTAKARAILGALRGNYIDVLVTDSSSAQLVLILADELDGKNNS